MTEPKARGLHRLVSSYGDAFHIPENLNHYAPGDFERARRRFVRFCLQHGCSFKGGIDFHGKRP